MKGRGQKHEKNEKEASFGSFLAVVGCQEVDCTRAIQSEEVRGTLSFFPKEKK